MNGVKHQGAPTSRVGNERRLGGERRGSSSLDTSLRLAGSGLKRYRNTKKGPPLVSYNEWDLLRKLRTSPEVSQAALVDSLTTAGIERTQIAAAQRRCHELRPAYLGKLAEREDKDVRETLLAAQKEDPEAFAKTKIDSIVRSLDKYELVNQVLFRRVYNSVSGEVELRCAIPTGNSGLFDFPGSGFTGLGFRERILLEYHNGSSEGTRVGSAQWRRSRGTSGGLLWTAMSGGGVRSASSVAQSVALRCGQVSLDAHRVVLVPV